MLAVYGRCWISNKYEQMWSNKDYYKITLEFQRYSGIWSVTLITTWKGTNEIRICYELEENRITKVRIDMMIGRTLTNDISWWRKPYDRIILPWVAVKGIRIKGLWR